MTQQEWCKRMTKAKDAMYDFYGMWQRADAIGSSFAPQYERHYKMAREEVRALDRIRKAVFA